jgi:hypothetical protein
MASFSDTPHPYERRNRQFDIKIGLTNVARTPLMERAKGNLKSFAYFLCDAIRKRGPAVQSRYASFRKHYQYRWSKLRDATVSSDQYPLWCGHADLYCL